MSEPEVGAKHRAAAAAVGELAFEHGMEDCNPPIVWRLTSAKARGNRVMRRSEWFVDEAAAWKRAKWLLDDGQEVFSVAKYVLERQG